MKNLGIFCLVIMVLLSALPCSDSEIATIAKKENQFSASSDTEDTENCLALCACLCCGQSVVQADIIVVDVKIASQPIEKPICYYSFRLPKADRNIWQPPKLS